MRAGGRDAVADDDRAAADAQQPGDDRALHGVGALVDDGAVEAVRAPANGAGRRGSEAGERDLRSVNGVGGRGRDRVRAQPTGHGGCTGTSKNDGSNGAAHTETS